MSRLVKLAIGGAVAFVAYRQGQRAVRFIGETWQEACKEAATDLAKTVGPQTPSWEQIGDALHDMRAKAAKVSDPVAREAAVAAVEALAQLKRAAAMRQHPAGSSFDEATGSSAVAAPRVDPKEAARRRARRANRSQDSAGSDLKADAPKNAWPKDPDMRRLLGLEPLDGEAASPQP